MNTTYDLLFVTHLPAFYKVNLYNQIAKKCRVFVIFISGSSEIRTRDFTQAAFEFDYCILNHEHFEKRNKIKSLFQLWKIIHAITFRKLIVGGWDLLEFWALALLSPKSKNFMALESSLYDSCLNGYRAFVKKLFLRRMSLVLSSGQPHQALLAALHYPGKIKTTLGVGIFNYQKNDNNKKTFSGKFLYVGRLAVEKNLKILLEVFATRPELSLTIIGQGPLRAELEALKTPNVHLRGHISNDLLFHEYASHDVFILPSLKEPWGLVIEEALYYGLPVIASEYVGCAQDLIVNQHAGVLFSPHDIASLSQAMKKVQENYQELINNIALINFKARDQHQVQQYIEALS